jgi:DNA-binding CsgD family transcriptional regulator
LPADVVLKGRSRRNSCNRERFIHPDNNRGILKLGSRGRIQFAGQRAMRCLRTFLGPGPKECLLPEAVLRWIQRETEGLGCWEKNGRHLTLTFLDPSRKGARYYLIEEGPATGPRLTAQEREILFWVRQGKSNAQIALILEVKLSTVKKHLQNASTKLGVDNRTAAACSLYNREETRPDPGCPE